MPNNLTIQLAVAGGREARAALSEIARAVRTTAHEADAAGGAGLGSWTQMIGTFRRAREALAPAREGFGELRRSVGELRESLLNVADRVFPHFREVAELAAGASAAGLVELAKHSAEGVRETVNLARSLGLTTEQYEQLKLAAAKAGVDQETLNTGLARFARALGNAQLAAKQGGAAAQEASKPFRELGISIAGSVGHIWTAEAGDLGRTLPSLQRVSQALNNVADSTQKAAIAEQFFGRGWLGIMPAFQNLDKDLTAANETIERYGIGLTQTEETQAQRFNAAWTTMETVVDRVKEMIGNAVGAALVPTIEQFTEIIGSNSGAIRDWAAGIASQAKPVLADFMALIKGAGRDALQTSFMRGLYDLATGLKTVFGGLVIVFDGVAAVLNRIFGSQISGQMLLTIAIIGQLAGAWGLVASAIGVVTTAIAVLGLPVFAGLIAGTVVGAMIDWQGSWDAIKATAEGFWVMLKSFASWVTREFLAVWQTTLGWIADKLKAIIEAAGKAISAMGGGATAPAPGYAIGGPVVGPAGVDRVPAWLTAGEFVMSARSVARYGRGFMSAINARRFASGGFVGDDTLSQGIDPGLSGSDDMVSSILGQAQSDKAVASHPYVANVGDTVKQALGDIIGSGGVSSLLQGILPTGISASMIKAVQVGPGFGRDSMAGGAVARLELALPNGQTLYLNGNPSDVSTIVNFKRLSALTSGGKRPSWSSG